MADVADRMTKFDKLLTTIEKTDKQIRGAVKAFASEKGLEQFRRAGVIAGLGTLSDEEKRIEKDWDSQMKQLDELTDNPVYLVESLEKMMPNETELPDDVLNAGKETMSKGVQYLAQNKPRDPFENKSMFLGRNKKFVPPVYEKINFRRKMVLVNNPMMILNMMGNNSITRGDVEVIQQVYPQLYNVIRDQFIQELMENPNGVPIAKRYQIFTLFDIRADPSLDFLATNQNIYQGEEEQPAKRSQFSGVAAEQSKTLTQKFM